MLLLDFYNIFKIVFNMLYQVMLNQNYKIYVSFFILPSIIIVKWKIIFITKKQSLLYPTNYAFFF